MLNSLHGVSSRIYECMFVLAAPESPGARWFPAAWLPGELAPLRVLSAGAFAEAEWRM